MIENVIFFPARISINVSFVKSSELKTFQSLPKTNKQNTEHHKVLYLTVRNLSDRLCLT